MLKKIACIIPARLESTRLPRKILEMIGDKTMIQLVWEAAHRCSQFASVHFAIDSMETAEVIDGFGGKWLMTNNCHPNGTSRLIECIDQISADIWVNWQADEPFITPQMINDLLQNVNDGMIWTLKKEIDNPEEIAAPQFVKVVTDNFGKALYFSRSPIPYNSQKYYKHIGLYAYTTFALHQIKQMTPSPLSIIESLEQLTFMEHGLPIQVHETDYEALGINTLEDLQKARSSLSLTYP